MHISICLNSLQAALTVPDFVSAEKFKWVSWYWFSLLWAIIKAHIITKLFKNAHTSSNHWVDAGQLFIYGIVEEEVEYCMSFTFKNPVSYKSSQYSLLQFARSFVSSFPNTRFISLPNIAEPPPVISTAHIPAHIVLMERTFSNSLNE
mgnify:CR=1 FL=1